MYIFRDGDWEAYASTANPTYVPKYLALIRQMKPGVATKVEFKK